MTEAAAWDNYWQSRERGGALTGIEHDEELKRFWRNTLSTHAKNSAMLDLACGAGTVLKIADALGFSDLTGADVSGSAIAVLKTALPTVKTAVTDAASTPFSDEAFAFITSQFGFEYAHPVRAAPEIARLLAPGGTFTAVSHKADGAIADEVRGHLGRANAITESGFIALSKALFAAAAVGDSAAAQKAAKALSPARDLLVGLSESSAAPFAKHLLDGAAQMWERHQHYAPDDIQNWFDAMQAENVAFATRMQDMLNAAMTQADVIELYQVFEANDLKTASPETLNLGGADAAWLIKATRTT